MRPRFKSEDYLWSGHWLKYFLTSPFLTRSNSSGASRITLDARSTTHRLLPQR